MRGLRWSPASPGKVYQNSGLSSPRCFHTGSGLRWPGNEGMPWIIHCSRNIQSCRTRHINRWSASSFKGTIKLFAGSAAVAALCTQTISLKEDLLFSRNYYSYFPFFNFIFSWSVLFFSSFLPSVMTHGLLFFSSLGRFVHFVLCYKHENNAIFCVTKLFYIAQILHNINKHFFILKADSTLC